MAVPYVIGQWVRGERFYGRVELLAEILDGPRDAVWLLGTRRIGKTSLLKQLEHLTAADPGRGYFPLFWDLQGADHPDELHLGFTDALLDAEDRLERLGLEASGLDGGDLFVTLGRLRRALRPRRLRLLLLCDEVEELIRLNEAQPALLRKLRHALQASADVRAVLASTIRLWALADQQEDTSPFLHGFTPPVCISTLTDEEARALLRQDGLPPAARPDLERDVVETLRRSCDNHPYLLQLVGKRYLELGDLEETIEGVAADQMVSYFFSVDFDMLSGVEQRILRSLARRSPVESDTLEASLEMETGVLRTALHNLANLGFVRRDGERQIFLANDFFRRWLTDLAPDEAVSGRPKLATGGTPATSLRSEARTAAYPAIEDRYELRRRVGEGATGIVYEAWDRLLETRIAVKLLRREYAGNPALLDRFRQEILLSRDLAHPNILRVYHLGRFEERAFLTMQWVDGPTLAAAIAGEGPFAPQRVAFVGARIASGLEAAHGHQVLHRDIKPGNVMLEAAGRPLITDFGLARLIGAPGATAAGVFVGTPSYVSPEQAALRRLDHRSDLYSLGVVLFELATGRCPFRAESTAEVLEMHRRQPPPDPRQLAEEIPPPLARLVLWCLEKEPERRIQTAGELRRRLERLVPEGYEPPPPAPVQKGEAPPVSKSSAADGASSRPAGLPADELMPQVYDELRRLARGFLSRERPDHTLEPTALVHEAYLRLCDRSASGIAGRSHFFALGARVMRHLLIDHARARGRIKRGGEVQKVTFMEGFVPDAEVRLDQMLLLDRALEELAQHSPRQAEIVELRFFGGLTVEEVAEHLGVSKRTVEGDWTAARQWLRRRLA